MNPSRSISNGDPGTGESGEHGEQGEPGEAGGGRGGRGAGGTVGLSSSSPFKLSTAMVAVIATVLLAGFGALYSLGHTTSDIQTKLDRNLGQIVAGQERNNDLAEARQRQICVALKDLTIQLEIRHAALHGSRLPNQC